MKVNSGIYNNKLFKKGLEFAADNGALFSASTTLALSATVRPVSIMLTPHTDKENKKVACAKSLASSVTGFLMTFAFSMPLMMAMSKIDKHPERFLKPETVKAYNKKSYEFATQMYKLGLATVLAIPKAILTCTGLPYVMQGLFPQKEDKGLTFKGKDGLARKIGETLDNKKFQKFANKHQDSNFPMHIFTCTDILATGAFVHQAAKSKRIEEDRKRVLIKNSIISTALSIICGYTLDYLTNEPTQKFIENFKKANKDLPNLNKQVEGIKIAKPVFLLATVYYGLIPFVSTFFAEKLGAQNK